MIGDIISHYRIVEKIGEGGMGVVYKAEDTRLKRFVALKFLPPQALKSEDEHLRFFREAQAAAALDHPNICTIYEIDEVDGHTFIAMGYIEGESLHSKIAGGPMDVGEALDIAIQIAKGLGEAHTRGIVHRDIKSANVMIMPNGRAKVMDFGIASLPGQTRLTKVGSTVGTLAYMSPQQARGEEVDGRADIWALGVLLYEMLTGTLPFRGDRDPVIIYNIVNQEPAPIRTLRPSLPPGIDNVIGKALAKEIEKRYQTTDELVAALESLGSGRAQKVRNGRPRTRSRRLARLIAGIIAAAFLAIVAQRVLFPPRSQAIRAIAVLPLENLSPSPDQEFLADGMTEALITGLAKIGNIRVISRTSVMQYKDTRKPLPDIARELHVDAVVEGSVTHVDDRVTIAANLINAATDEHMWADEYNREMKDVLTLQSEVARAIAKQITLKLTPIDETRLSGERVVVPNAFEAYVKGRHYWNKRTREGILESRDYFQEAISIDPNYAMAYVGLAEAYILCVSYQLLPANDVVPKIREAANRALELNPTLGEAQNALAAVTDKECRFAEVLQDYDRAVRMSPNYATARQWYAEALSRLGHNGKAKEEIATAYELDPLSLPINTVRAVIAYNSREYEQALDRAKTALELDPNFPPAVGLIAKIYDMMGNYDEAIRYYERYMELGGIDPGLIAGFDAAYARGGMDGSRRWYVDNFRAAALGQLSLGSSLALAYAMLGESDEAFEWLGRLSDDHCWNVADIKVEPMFDSLRNDPRYDALLRKVGLEG